MNDSSSRASSARLVERFRPSRAGIVNLWDYVDQRFRFEDGRLVLRGANGSGKTKALEVLFPFVLDARLIAQRLDPFTTTGRNMRENLLYRGDREVSYGYAWMEFERVLADGRTDRRTIGAGMRAQTQRDGVTSWFFVTDLSLDTDFSLVDEGRPLTRRQLTELLGPDCVFERGGEYRSRVDHELFGLGEDRYEALLQLVLFLRRPQLAKDLDLGELSRVLAEGLRPVDDELVGQAARSFEDLELVQLELERLQSARAASDAFLDTYRRYLRANARKRVEETSVRRRTLLAAERRVGEIDDSLREARAALMTAEAARDRVLHETQDADVARDALRRSDAYRAAESLSHLEGRVADAEAAASAAAADAERAGRQKQEADELVRREQSTLDATLAEADRARSKLSQSASQAGLEIEEVPADASGAEQLVKDRDAGRRADLAAIRQLLHQRDLVAAAADTLDRQVDAAEGAEAQAREALDEASTAIADARHSLRQGLVSWAEANATVIAEADSTSLATAVDVVGEPEQPALVELVRARVAERRDRARADEVTMAGQLSELEAELSGVRDERDVLAAQRDNPPPEPYTRAEPRDDRGGAPLWRLVDFAPGLDPRVASTVEAALESSGLLDAWVYPNGAIDVAALDDSFLGVDGDATTAAGSPALDRVLVADETAGDLVPREVVLATLASISWNDVDTGDPTAPEARRSATGVDGSGRWRLGPLHGHWTKPAAQYIGSSARAAHRAHQLAQCDTRIKEMATAVASAARQRDEHRMVVAAIDEAIRTVPPVDGVLVAIREADRAAARLTEAAAVATQGRAEHDQARRVASDAQVRLEAEASTRRLPVSPADLDQVAAALDRFRDDGASLVAQLALLERARGHLEMLLAQAATRASEHEESESRSADSRRHLFSLTTELDTLRSSLGESAREVLDRIDALDRRLDQLRHDERAAQADLVERAATTKGFEVELAGASDRIAEARSSLDRHAAHLLVFARPDVLAVLDPAVLDTVLGTGVLDAGVLDAGVLDAGVLDAGVLDAGEADRGLQQMLVLHDVLAQSTEGASAVEERLKSVFTALSNSFHDLQAGLGAEYQPELDVDDEIEVFSVVDEMGRQPVSSFAARLASRCDEQSTLLSERERQVFEDTLLASLASQMHQRIIDAHDQVDRMNKSLEQRAMSSGLRLQLSWKLPDDLPPDRRAIARLLERDPALFNEKERDQLRNYFSSEIGEVRSVDPAASYKAVLLKVLDYRGWRVFTPRLIHPGGREQVLTRKVFSTLSGGEKATALHLPLFAASASHYSSARPEAPHLIALDEAFAGIDDDTQGKLMGLTVEFDLDLFLTGHDLWGTHENVPALSIYDLIHLNEEHVVHAMRFRWNGSDLEKTP